MGEIEEVKPDGSPKKDKITPRSISDHLFKYEVEETEPDDDEMVELHTIEADDVKREKGVLTREKLATYLKNVVELEGLVFKLKPKAIAAYNLETMKFSEIFAGPEPEFEESLRKLGAQMNKNKKGQFTLDGWATKGANKSENIKTTAKEKPVVPVVQKEPPKKKQTPEEIEEEMKKIREAQAKYREEMRIKIE